MQHPFLRWWRRSKPSPPARAGTDAYRLLRDAVRAVVNGTTTRVDAATIEALTRLAKEKPCRPDLLEWRAITRCRMVLRKAREADDSSRDWVAAVRDFSCVVQQNPDRAVPYVGRGLLYLISAMALARQGRSPSLPLRQAVADLRRASELSPEDPSAPKLLDLAARVEPSRSAGLPDWDELSRAWAFGAP